MAKHKRPTWKDSDAPDAMIKSRKGNVRKIVGSLNQQIVFNRKRNPSYAKKMKCARNKAVARLKKK